MGVTCCTVMYKLFGFFALLCCHSCHRDRMYLCLPIVGRCVPLTHLRRSVRSWPHTKLCARLLPAPPLFLETGSCCTGQASTELVLFLPQLQECGDYRMQRGNLLVVSCVAGPSYPAGSVLGLEATLGPFHARLSGYPPACFLPSVSLDTMPVLVTPSYC